MKGSYLNSYTIREIAKINVGRDLVENSFSKDLPAKSKKVARCKRKDLSG
jgi:hypothetical protein